MVDMVMVSSELRPRERSTMPMPKYEQFAEHIRVQVRAGELQPGERLPSTSTYMAQGWKRGTIVAGMRVLRAEGWVRGQPGEAVYVAENHPSG